jgi:hypothetical protein
MAEGVYRYYAKDASPVVEAITVVFYEDKVSEPLLLVGKISYLFSSDTSIRNVCKPWDLWELYFKSPNRTELGKVIRSGADATGRLEWSKMLAIPLLSVKRIEEVADKMGEVSRVEIGVSESDSAK